MSDTFNRETKKEARMIKANKGFTLIELLIVMAVVAILISIVIPSFKGMQDQANVSKAKSELAVLQSALESYYIHNRAYPASGADSDFPDLSTQTPAIMTAAPPSDPFSNQDQYKYRVNGRNYVIYSVGPDGNAAADIDNAGATPVISETNTSCIYISNIGRDTQP